MCCDGDSTLLGRKAGVIAKLLQLNNSILPIHCMAHRTALVVSAAAKCGIMKRIDSVLVIVYALFNRSSKRQSQWSTFARRFGLSRLKFPMFNTTRWLSRMECITTLVESVYALCLFITAINRVKTWDAGEKVMGDLGDSEVFLMLHVLIIVLEPVNTLVLLFQRNDIKPHELIDAVKNARSLFKRCPLLRS
eukprot:jgi/Botrbrau1/14680/Bobra.0108s0037.1